MCSDFNFVHLDLHFIRQCIVSFVVLQFRVVPIFPRFFFYIRSIIKRKILFPPCFRLKMITSCAFILLPKFETKKPTNRNDTKQRPKITRKESLIKLGSLFLSKEFAAVASFCFFVFRSDICWRKNRTFFRITYIFKIYVDIYVIYNTDTIILLSGNT